MPKRYLILLGAQTTSGGTVKTASSFMSYNGVPYALEGDLVDCPACGHEGTIQCVAPRHGFELPPTTFAALTFGKSVLETISTSPMLEARRFPEAVEILGQVQARFQAGGWVPWVGNQNGWYDLSPKGRKTLRAELMRYSQSDQFLDVPKRNLRSLLRIKCVEHCDDPDDALYLVDVSIGKKSWYTWDGQ